MNALALFSGPSKRVDDWLSPILVKELRQGMRGRVFVLSFLLLQVFLVVLTLSNVAAQEDRNMLSVLNHFFWVIVGFALLVAMPLRGLTTVSLEMRNRTLETIMLTRLTAWRVVFGKWSALFAQSLLLVSAVLPYVVLRYFLGGDDVVSDFEWMLFLLWLSGLLIAASIAISALTVAIMRIIILVGVVIFSSVGLGAQNIPGVGTSASELETIGWLVLVGFFVPALLFELSASGIAPVSENHALRRRLLAGCFFAGTAGLAAVTHSDFNAGVMAVMIILIGICYFELGEKVQLVPRMVQNMARKGPLGMPLAAFLLPGWPSGLLFSLLAIPAAMAATFKLIGHAGVPWILPMLAVFGSVLAPIALCHLLFRKLNHVLLVVLLYNVILFAVVSVLEGLDSLTHFQADTIFAFFPSLPVLFIAMNAHGGTFGEYLQTYLVVNSCVVLLLLGLLFFSSIGYFKRVTALFREARRSDTSLPDPASP